MGVQLMFNRTMLGWPMLSGSIVDGIVPAGHPVAHLGFLRSNQSSLLLRVRTCLIMGLYEKMLWEHLI
jgi:hypothetical protein